MKGGDKMNKGGKNLKRKSVVVQWNNCSGKDTGAQSHQMSGAAESGCCRQGGSPCSSKKFSS